MKLRPVINYILSVHILALAYLFVARVILILVNIDSLSWLEGISDVFWYMTPALARGFWFDNIIVSYISILPALVLGALAIGRRLHKQAFHICNAFYIIVYTIVWGFSIGDIPYFNYFFKHIDSSILMWKGETAVFGMMFQEKSYYIYLLLFFIFSISFAFALVAISRRIAVRSKKQDQTSYPRRHCVKTYVASALILALLSIGAVGYKGYNPLGKKIAEMGDRTFITFVGDSPTFNFCDSFFTTLLKWEKVKDILSEEDAIKYVQTQLNIVPAADAPSPLFRHVKAGEGTRDMNVVIVLMESMSADLLAMKDRGKEITPFLNHLRSKSIYFDNCYSPGNRTNQGVAAALYGVTSMFDQHMLHNKNLVYAGLPTALQAAGYNTLFFVPHTPMFDNMDYFLKGNAIDELYSMDDYPPEEQANSFGVPDKYLFNFGLKKLNEKAADGKPFFATILTVSNHPPYVIPKEFEAVSNDPLHQIVAYCDDAIRIFFEEASKQDWYDNTLFVLLGDHGLIYEMPVYEIPVSQHHIPLIIYSPALEHMAQTNDNTASQIDVYPTVMGLLGRSYNNNTLGIDLLNEKRRYAPISTNGVMGCLDGTMLYSYNIITRKESLSQYKAGDPKNYTNVYVMQTDSMRRNSAATVETQYYMFKNNLTHFQ